MKKHKVKTHNWIGGILRSREFIFECFEDAIKFLENSDNHSAKVFDDEGRLTHEHVRQTKTDSYA